MNSKDFVANTFNTNPQRYGIDDGDLNMVNDYFTKQGWELLTREQFSALASLIRTRNKFLADNPNYDLRKKHETAQYIQLTLFDFLPDDTATQIKKLARYFSRDEKRLEQSNSRTKDGVRGADNEHITAVKLMLPLFVSAPKLNKVRINTDKTSTAYTDVDDDLGEKTQTKLGDKEAGE